MCSYSNKNAATLRMHKKMKHGGTLISCDMCDYQAGQNADMDRHKLAKHLNGCFACSQCSYKGSQPALLKAHIKLKHGNPPERRCPDCDFVSAYPAALRRHQLKHSGQMLKCLLCPYKTIRADNLKSHVTSRHTNLRYRYLSLNSQLFFSIFYIGFR
jgi:KRAB domain-containing zinc finger protein